MERRAGQGRPRMYFPFVLSLVHLHTFSGDECGSFLCLSFVFPLSFILVVGGPTMTG